MKKLDDKQKFIQLRSLGYSIISASKLTGIARSTGTIWNREFEKEINLLSEQQAQIFREECAIIRRKSLQFYKILFEKLTIDFLSNGFPNLTPNQKFKCLMKVIDCIEKLDLQSQIPLPSPSSFHSKSNNTELPDEDKDNPEPSIDLTQLDLLEIENILPNEKAKLVEEGSSDEELEIARKHDEFIQYVVDNQKKFRKEIDESDGKFWKHKKYDLVWPLYVKEPPLPLRERDIQPRVYRWEASDSV